MNCLSSCSVAGGGERVSVAAMLRSNRAYENFHGIAELDDTSPSSGAVPSNLPLMRSAADMAGMITGSTRSRLTRLGNRTWQSNDFAWRLQARPLRNFALLVRLIATTDERWLARIQILIAGLQGASGLITEIAAIKPCNAAFRWIEYLAGMKSKRFIAGLSAIKAFNLVTRLFTTHTAKLPARAPRKVKQVL
jgi:hypothetical protein